MMMSVSTITLASLRILARAFLVPLCLWMMVYVERARLRNRESIPTIGLVAGESHVVSSAARRSKAEIINRYFCILNSCDSLDSPAMLIDCS